MPAVEVIRREPSPRSNPGERRQTTILFCDLVGSTDLSERLDPEDLHAVLEAFQRAAVTVIERYEGHVAQYLGDGILVYFGFPRAQEDDPQRAVSAALGIREAIAAIRPDVRRDHDVDLQVRIGAHVGEAVAGSVGAGSRTEQLLVGRAPNLAARLQGLAGPGQVVISGDLAELVRPMFELAELGTHQLKGIAEPVQVFEVVALLDTTTRFEAMLHQQLSPLVGRTAELASLRERFDGAAAGSGHMAWISGEAGIGKSRLVHALRDGIGPEACTWLVCQCSPLARGTAFQPILDLLRRLVGLHRIEQPTREPIDRLYERLGLDRDDASITASFLGLDDARAQLGLIPEAWRARFLASTVAVLIGLGRERPLVLVVEDVHWIDPSSLELLTGLIDAAGAAPVLVVMTSRPEFDNPWSDRPHFGLTLQRLTAAQAEELIRANSGAAPLDERLLAEIVRRADGVPLFVEELARAVRERGVSQDEIPTTLRALLTARLDRLGPARDTAQAAAAVGRVFSIEVLAESLLLPAQTVQDHTRALVDAQLAHAYLGSDGRLEYTFNHALVQDAAYAMMLKERRRDVHGRIAEVLSRRGAEPERLAYHLERAERPAEAIEALRDAAAQAVARSGHAEAIDLLERALAQLRRMPVDAASKHLEVELRITLGASLVVAGGYGHPQLEPNYVRARALCDELGDPPVLLSVLYGLWVHNLAASQRAGTHHYMEEIRAFVPDDAVGVPAVVREFTTGCTLYYGGRYADSLRHLRRLHDGLWSLDQHVQLTTRFLDDSGLWAYSWRVWIHLVRGEFAQSAACADQLLACAEAVKDPRSLAKAHCWRMVHHHETRDPQAALAAADQLIALSQQQALPYWLCHGLIGRGLALIELGTVDPEQGLQIIDSGLQIYHLVTDLRLPISYWTLYKVRALITGGALDQALRELDILLDGSLTALEANMRPEELRFKAGVLALQGQGEAALQHYDRAAALAHEHGAPLYEIRARVPAIRLARQLGRDVADAEARLCALLDGLPEMAGYPEYAAARNIRAGAA